MSFLIKSVLALLMITFAALAADATPALGDKATYDVTLTRGSDALSGMVSFELTDYDKSTDIWTQVSITHFSGQTQSQTEKISSKDLLSDALIDQVMNACTSRGGKSETISTPAGDIPSCGVPVNNSQGKGTLWVAKTPFGYSKWIAHRKDGVTVTGVLRSYRPGKSGP